MEMDMNAPTAVNAWGYTFYHCPTGAIFSATLVTNLLPHIFSFPDCLVSFVCLSWETRERFVAGKPITGCQEERSRIAQKRTSLYRRLAYNLH